jgi:RecB family exonuclease
LSGIDPFGRPSALVVTTTATKRRDIERGFVDFRAETPVFAPEVRVWSDLVDSWWARHGDGRALLSPRSERMIAEQVLQAGAATWPRLAALGHGPAVAGALAALRADYAASGLDEPPASWSPDVAAAVLALESRLGGAAGHLPRTTAIRRLLRLLTGTPPRAWVQQLRAFPSVVIDDLLDMSALENELLFAACHAWSTAGAHVVVCLETERDGGAPDVATFFGVEAEESAPTWLRPFRAVRRLRQSILERWIAGGQADLLLAGPGGVQRVEPGDSDLAPEKVEATTLHTAIQKGKACVTVYRDAAAEARGVAAGVQAALRAGADPRDLVVAAPDPGACRDRYLAVFAAHGIPLRVAAPAPLAHLPLAALTLAVAQAAHRGWPRDLLLGILASDLVDHGEGPRLDVGALARRAAAAGAPDGLPSAWSPALSRFSTLEGRSPSDPTADLARLEMLLAPLAALDRRASPARWCERLVQTLDHLGVLRTLQDRGQIGIASWAALQSALADWVVDLNAAFDADIEPDVLIRHLQSALAAAPGPADPVSERAVSLVRIQDLRGLTPARCWIVGLVRGAFPRAPAASFLAREAAEATASLDPSAEDRWLFASLLRNVLDDRAMIRLELSWPHIVDGREALGSTLLADLPPDGVDRRLGPAASPSCPDELLVQAATFARVNPTEGSSALFAVPPALRDVVEWAWERHQDRSGDRPGPWTGALERPPGTVPAEISVTALETFLGCPARYWYRFVLNLSPERPPSPDVPPDVKGTAMHRIVQRFLAPRLGTPVRGDRAVLSQELHDIAVAELRPLEASYTAPLVQALRDEWVSGLVDPRPRGVLSAWLDQELLSPWIPESVEMKGRIPLGEGALVARLDRVDVTRSGRLVIDYKTGRAPAIAKVRRGLALQPIAYARIIQNKVGGRVATTFIELRRAREVARRGSCGDELVLAEIPSRERKLRPEDVNALLQHAEDGYSRLRKGLAHTTLARPNEVGCRSCDFRHVCDTSLARAQRTREGAADVQRPVEVGGDA